MHLEKAHVHSVVRNSNSSGGGRRKHSRRAKALGGQSEKTEGYSLFNFEGSPHLLADLGAKAELTPEGFYPDIPGDVLDFSPPALLPFCQMFSL